jgi:hypothetical protein
MASQSPVSYGGAVADTLDQFTRDFTSLFQHRAFRLLVLDWYDADNEHKPYADFLADRHVDPAWRRRWQQKVREIRESGRLIQRVHLTGEPVPDYVRFCLLHGYPYNVDAGEEVRISGRNGAEHLTRRGDFWLFDERLAAELIYDTSGLLKRIEMHTDKAVLTELRSIRDESLRLAVPLARYVTKHKIGKRETWTGTARTGSRLTPATMRAV